MVVCRRDIGEVLTPRQAIVKARMYASRPELEKALEDAVYGSTHVLLFGESGNGESWQGEAVLKNMRIPVCHCGLRLRSRSQFPAGSMAVSFREARDTSSGLGQDGLAERIEGSQRDSRDFC